MQKNQIILIRWRHPPILHCGCERRVIIVTDGSGDKPVPTLASVSGPLAGTMRVHTRLFVLNNNREERGVFTRTFSLIICYC